MEKPLQKQESGKQLKPVAVKNLRVLLKPDGDLYLDDRFILCSKDLPLTEKLLNQLHTWKFTTVFLDAASTGVNPASGSTAFPLPEQVTEGERIPTAKVKVDWDNAVKAYITFLERQQKIFDLFGSKQVLQVEEVSNLVKDLQTALKDHHPHLLKVIDLDRNGFSYLTCHSVNTALLCLALAEQMRLPPHRTQEVGMAALLHEVGMLHRTYAPLQSANRALTPEENKAIRAHPVISYRVLKDKGFPANACLGVLAHHERPDGKGYPQGLQADSIAISAKIVSVASAFDALTSTRPYRRSYSGFEALKLLVEDIGKAYDQTVVKYLVALIGFIPLGSHVQLQSGAYAYVHDLDPAKPKNPRILVLTAPGGQPLGESVQTILGFDEPTRFKVALNREDVQKLRAEGVIPRNPYGE